MSDVIDDILEDASDEANASRARKQRRRAGEGNRVMYALSNGLGLIMTRVSVWLIAIILAVIGWTGNYLLNDINDSLSNMRTGLREMRDLIAAQNGAINDIKVDVATVKQRQNDLDARK